MTPHTLLDNVFSPGALSVVFQPLFALDEGRLRQVGQEGLIRGPQGTSLEEADRLFAMVRRMDANVAVDRACVTRVLREAQRFGDMPLSVNVSARSILRDEGLPLAIALAASAVGRANESLVIDVNDCRPVHREPAFREAILTIRRLGMGIAFDEPQFDREALGLVFEHRPTQLKLDRSTIRGCNEEPEKLALVRDTCRVARRLGTDVVAEGVETKEELDCLAEAGVALVQGNLLAPAMPAVMEMPTPEPMRAAL